MLVMCGWTRQVGMLDGAEQEVTGRLGPPRWLLRYEPLPTQVSRKSDSATSHCTRKRFVSRSHIRSGNHVMVATCSARHASQSQLPICNAAEFWRNNCGVSYLPHKAWKTQRTCRGTPAQSRWKSRGSNTSNGACNADINISPYPPSILPLFHKPNTDRQLSSPCLPKHSRTWFSAPIRYGNFTMRRYFCG
jgi:hypothetical protein